LLLSLIAAPVLSLAACRPQPAPSAEEILQRYREAATQGYHSHHVMEAQFGIPPGPPPMEVVVEQWLDGPDRMRLLFLETPAQRQGSFIVRSGDAVWQYDLATQTYAKTTVAITDALKTPFLPYDDPIASLVRMADGWVDTMTFTLEGTEEVAGRKAYKLAGKPREDLKPEERPIAPPTVTLWIDSESYMPLRMAAGMPASGTLAMTMRSIEVDPDLPEDTFTFVPPEGATDMSPGVRPPGSMTLEQARKAVEFPVLVPEEPGDGLELREARIVTLPVTATEKTMPAVTLMYTNTAGTRIDVEQFQVFEGAPDLREFARMAGAELRDVQVGPFDGFIAVLPDGNRVTWHTDQTRVIVRGQVDPERLLEFAQGFH
jgi:outer membrane lipoprotein-sorting protein